MYVPAELFPQTEFIVEQAANGMNFSLSQPRFICVGYFMVR